MAQDRQYQLVLQQLQVPQAWQKVMAAYCHVYGMIHFTSPAG